MIKVNFDYTDELLILNKILNNNGSEDNLRIVGGAIRNFLINENINDYDLSCKFLPEQNIKILEENNIKVVPTGIKFGTVTAIINKKSFEITTTRKDIKTDGRHADVEFTDNFEIDAERRDFTFNALYLDFNNNVYDYFDGITDLNKGIVRFIGNAEKRIQEDYLRILRFFRFFSYYGIVLDNEGLKYSIKYKEKLKELSGERIKNEMFKILTSDYPLITLDIMNKNNILQIITELDNFNFEYLNIFFSIKKYLNINFDATFVIALILSNINELEILKNRWKLSKKEDIDIFNFLKHKNDNLYSKHDIKTLMFNLLDKEKLVKLVVFNALINYNRIDNNILNYINDLIYFIDNETIPVLPITINDLHNFDKKQYNFLIKKANKLFIQSNFLLSKDQIIKELEKLAN